jgi:hypothetical protein
MKDHIQAKDIDRLLLDSRASTLTEMDELCFIRLVLKCLATGMSYSEALSCCHAQLSDSINNGE